MSLTKIALLSMIAHILLPGPCRAGNWECSDISSNPEVPWSIAYGMRDGICMFFLGSVPQMWGKVENAVAACTEAKWIFPMQSLHRRGY